jgi:HEAT repeat protein
MRYEAALASGELALRSAVPILSRMVEDSDREVSNAAVWALGQIGGEEAKVALLDALDQEDQDTQAAVNDALAELALSEGQLDFALYDVDDDSVDDLDIDVLLPLWEAGDEDGEEPGEE